MLSPALVALLKRVSRSFYLSVRVLPAPVRGQVALGYLLARAADTIADTPLLPARERLELLVLLRGAIHGQRAEAESLHRRLVQARPASPTSAASAAEQQLLETLPECLALLDAVELSAADRRLIEEVLDKLTTGMERDLRRFPAAELSVPPEQVVALDSWAELDEYTYYAAGCVGEFWTDLLAAHIPSVEKLSTPRLRECGIKLGKALQLVNVIRDVAADLRAGRCYWPRELLAAHGLSPVRLAELAHPSSSAQARAPVTTVETTALLAINRTLLEHTRRTCEEAWPYVRAIPSREVRLRLSAAWPLLIALETLAALRQSGSPMLLSGSPPVKIDRSSVYRLLAASSAEALGTALYVGVAPRLGLSSDRDQLDRDFAARLRKV